MNHRPASPDQGPTFNLAALTEQLRIETSYVHEGHAARTLVRTPDLRIVLVALRAGTTVAEHHASVTASVQALSGHIRLQLPDKLSELEAGGLLVLGAGLPHDVFALTDSAFLLTLGWSAHDHQGATP